MEEKSLSVRGKFVFAQVQKRKRSGSIRNGSGNINSLWLYIHRKRNRLLSWNKKTMANLRKSLLFGISRFLNSTSAPARVHCSPSSAGVIPYQTLYRPSVNSFSRFFSTDIENQPVDIDFSDEESKRRLVNRLVYRSKQRGYLELDLILGTWVENHIGSLDEKGIKALVDVLNMENPDLWKWLTGQEQPPEAIKTNPVFTEVHSKVMNNLDSHASPETRATPGQPWVRGWDDFKKGRDSPIVGNQ